MENNDKYYKKYMKYKLKYLNLLDNYQSNNDTSESFDASKIISGGAMLVPLVTSTAFNLAKSKTGREILKKGVKAAAGSDTLKTMAKQSVKSPGLSNVVGQVMNQQKNLSVTGTGIKPSSKTTSESNKKGLILENVNLKLKEKEAIKSRLTTSNEKTVTQPNDETNIPVSPPSDQTKVGSTESSAQSILKAGLASSSNISDMINNLPIDQLKPIIFEFIEKNPNIKNELKNFLNKHRDIKSVICDKK